MQMKRKWIQIIMTLLLIQLIVADNSYGADENEENEMLSLELVHRHDSRFGGDAVDQVQAMKGFIQRDLLRRQQMNQRKGINQYHHRRKDMEVRKEFQMPMHSGRDYAVGEYFVEVEVGTPGQSFWLVADTGTKDDPNDPCNGIFCPHRSRTFLKLPCSSKICTQDLSGVFSLSYCPNNSDPCLFDISYADGSSATGFFGIDTLSLNLTNGRKGKLENLTIGCTESVLNGITFNENTGGILGLGFAKGSFVDKASLKYNTKFSYCLVDHLSHRNVSSYLTFGNPKVKLLAEKKTTELFLYQPFYGVNVTGISIGREMLNIPPSVWDFEAQGGMIIDSGTTLAALVLDAYEPVVEALTKSLSHLKKVDKSLADLDFCFDSEGFEASSVPSLVFHFGGGVTFAPPVRSYIIDFGPNVKCLGFVPINGTGVSVIGNIMQQSHLWQIDVYQNTVSFAPSRCS
ncbi:unnamed protein product [Vicia faba]|uniref:Peptidase A1 domain-containing protein n=1 Tax=Vicia faba TaxID=3906 RepID=A0AAV0YNH3_VICFA|nr:unnamed protein product [Vicia faba]